MKWEHWLDQWGMTGLRINLHFLQLDWAPSDKDKDAAWELYIELLTRITTQPLAAEHGDEATALESVYSLFPLTRATLKNTGRGCEEFAKIAVVVLNQVVRPFTAKWHRLSLAGVFEDPAQSRQFREELEVLQAQLRRYTQMMADMAGVEDLTSLERVDASA